MATVNDAWVPDPEALVGRDCLRCPPTRSYQAISGDVVDTLPDLTFILDLTEEAAAGPREARQTGAAMADSAEAICNFHSIREGFLEVARRYPGRCRVIDATATPEYVHEAI